MDATPIPSGPIPDEIAMLLASDIEAMRLWFPHVLRGVADRFGNGAALKLADSFGGQYVYLPAKAKAAHPVARRVGVDVLSHLIERFGATERMLVPLAVTARKQMRDARAWRLMKLGHPVNAVAQACGMHVRTVERVRERMNRDAKQPSSPKETMS